MTLQKQSGAIVEEASLFLLNGVLYLKIDESEHWIDKKHIEYWDECIDETFKPVALQTEVVMIPEKVRNSMK